MAFSRRSLLLATISTGMLFPGCKSSFRRDAQPDSFSQTTGLTRTFSEPHGRYLGFLRISDHAKMPFVMDLVPGSVSGREDSMRAIVRIHLGGFSSPEFTSFYFPVVERGISGNLEFLANEGAKAAVSLDGARLDDGRFTAKFILLRDGAVDESMPKKTGFVEARFHDPRVSSMSDVLAIGGGVPSIGLLSGQYDAVCDGHQSSLQIEYSRWNRMPSEPQGGFFPGGMLTGRLGVSALDSCKGDSLNCVQRIFRSGTFDPFTGQLAMHSLQGKTECRVSGFSVNCEACNFSRTSSGSGSNISLNNQSFQRAEETVYDAGAPVDLASHPGAMAGGFYGYLHHEATNAYQPLSMSFNWDSASSTYSAVSALYFGAATSNEFVAYRFDPVPSRALEGRLTLDGPGEAFVIVTATGSKGLWGIWYSKTHGRIGTVSLVRNSMPPLMVDESLLISSIGGVYSGEQWQLDIKVAANVSENHHEFYPLRMFGEAREKGESRKRRLIQDGTFDFYTGVVALRLDDGRIIVGRTGNTGLNLFWPPWPRLGPMPDSHMVQSFTRVDPADRTIAARK